MIYDKCSNRWHIKNNSGCVVGELRYWKAAIDEEHMYDFYDYSTEVYLKFYGTWMKEVSILVDEFYSMKDNSVGYLRTTDPNSFIETLNLNQIDFFRVENNLFFFNDENDLIAARLLV